MIKYLSCVCLAVLLAASVSLAATARFNRQGKGDLFVIVQYLGDDTAALEDLDAIKLELGPLWAGGIGFAYHLHQHVSIGTEIILGTGDVNVGGFGVTVAGDTTVFGLNVNLEINVLKSRFTPVLGGGIGFLSFNGDVDGASFEETDFSYHLDAGLRWDLSRHFFVKGVYRFTGTQLEDTDEALLLGGPVFSLGFTF